jgi:bacillaene synthase trans-acting acyltransferase
MNGEIVFMFSGQGSQYFHMGRSLYEHNETFRDWMLRLDAVALRASGISIVGTLYSDARTRGESFDRLRDSHPAIFMVEYALAQTLIEAGVRPDMVLGVSMGSFAAAAVAGYIDAEDALTAVIRQATALEERSERGGMIAILADPAMFTGDLFRGRCELAGVNFSSHFVVSAKPAALAEIEAGLRQDNVTYQRLPVAFPFHSQWIDDAKGTFDSFMQSVPRTRGMLPMVCSDRTTVQSDVDGDYFWNVVRHPIRFRETAARLEQEGPRRYIDVGPAGTLATFLKYGLPATTKSTVQSILTPFGFDQKNLAAVLASTGH